jgi:hypothetical protein
MYIIIGEEKADILRESHTVLSLEKIKKDNFEDRAYCIIPSDVVGIAELSLLKQYVDLHEQFVTEYEKGNYKYCQDASEHLYGKFGGELDSFYDEILKRIS